MWNFSIAKALGLMIRTLPFLVFRALVYFAVAAAMVLATGAGAGIGYGIGLAGDDAFQTTSTFWGGLAGFGLTAGVIFFLRDSLLYLVKAGQIAVMVDYLDGRPLPFGRGQIAHARAVVTERFGQATALFALDRLVRGVIGFVTGLVEGALTLLPVPGLGPLMGAIRAWLRVSVGLVDEVILAHAIRTRSENAWEAAHDALVLYAQNGRAMLANAALVTLISWGLAIAVFLLALGPAAALAWLLPGQSGAAVYALALIFAWAVKAALIEPFALACMLQVFANVTAGQEPLPEWRGRLTQMSDKFRRLGEQAIGWAPVGPPAQ